MRRLLCGLLVVACSGDPGPQGEQGERGRTGESAVVEVRRATAAECANGGEVLTVGVGADLEEVVLCDGEDGEDGAPGEPGEDGAPGATGPAGPAGADAKPTAVSDPVVTAQHCLAAIDDTITVDYWFREFESGDVWASAVIFDSAFSASNSNYYGATQDDVITAPVQVAFDLQGPSFGGRWVIGMYRDELTMVVTYVDSDLLAGITTWSIEASDMTCQAAAL